MKYIVYNTINTINLKSYIGVHKTETPDIFDGYIGNGVVITRPSSYMNPTTPFQFAVKKYGTDSFKRSVLKIFDTLEDALDLERWLVDTNYVKRKDTYNVVLGGTTSSYYFPIYQFDLKGNLLKEWFNIREASDFYSITPTSIANAIKFKGSSINYYWSKNNNINIKEYSLNTGTKCYKYSEDGKFLEDYNSIPEAAKANNTSNQSIQRSIKGGYSVNSEYYSDKLMETFIKTPKLSLKNKSIFIYDLEGIFIKELKDSKEIYSFFNITSTSVITTAIRTGRQYKDYQISLDYVEKMDKLINKRNIPKPVLQLTETGELIDEFESMTKAVELFGTGVQKVLKGQQQKCKGFIFRYKS